MDTTTVPAPRLLVYALRAVAAAGLATSIALAFDYLGPEPAFCADGGGCATLRASRWARPLGLPMPLLGVAFFATALALSATTRARALRLVAAAGAVGAAGLLVVQGVVLGTWCKLCVVADTSALALAGLAFVLGARSLPRQRRLVAVLAVAAVALPVGYGVTRPEERSDRVVTAALPEVVAREQRAGVITVVDFLDFECPHCRRFQARLDAAIEAVGAPVRVVRKMVPLAIHRGAMPAALAWCCADEHGAGDAMASALLAADPATLTPEGCERLATALGLDPVAVRAGISAPSTRARVDADLADAAAAQVQHLPTVYVGDERFTGARATQAELEAALRRAAVAAAAS